MRTLYRDYRPLRNLSLSAVTRGVQVPGGRGDGGGGESGRGHLHLKGVNDAVCSDNRVPGAAGSWAGL